jgi:S-adenosylmethionine:tRNA ribosyltransferase-isomerase
MRGPDRPGAAAGPRSDVSAASRATASPRPMTLDDFDYELPPELIAQHPPDIRGAGRLMHVDAPAGTLADGWFRDLPEHLRAGDVVVMNDTRVIPARLFGEKSTGGRVEVLVERILGPHEALTQLRASKPPGPGSRLVLEPDLEVEVLGRVGEFWHLRFASGTPLLELLDRHGRLPLPPYIERAAGADDAARYQTVYAKRPGAVAAPTAGLHFDEAMLERVRATGARIVTLTLHVGAGTFQPVRVDDISQHQMHSEWYDIPQEVVDAVAGARRQGGRVLAVGTTSLRALESAAMDNGMLQAGSAETRLFVTPGHRFRVVDRLFTNFHLPKSTLLMLVSAFGGIDLLRRAYAQAIAQRYRFFSYGDAMLIERAPEAAWPV